MFPGMGPYEPCKRCKAPTGEGHHGFSLHESHLVGEHETFCPSCLETWEKLCVAQLKPQAISLYRQFLAANIEPSVDVEVRFCIGAGPWPKYGGCHRKTTRIFDGTAVCDSCDGFVRQYDYTGPQRGVADWSREADNNHLPPNVVDVIRRIIQQYPEGLA